MGGQGQSLSPFAKAKDDLKCTISGRSIDETIMGFGVNVTTEQRGQKVIKTITTDLCPISYESFYDDKVRTSSGGQPINFFLPFALNGAYWEKALTVAEKSIREISGHDLFSLEDVLDVIGELWKTKVVEMMKGEEHASEKILFGFCAFHHLLLAFAQSYPFVFFLF